MRFVAGRSPHRPRVVVVYAGDNDIANGKSPAQVEQDFRHLVRSLHTHLPTTKILFIAIKPSVARWKLIDRIREANAAVRGLPPDAEVSDGIRFALKSLAK